MSYKLGSLFDGSGGFPLASSLCGIEPRWASEVEPYPIAVTRERFPQMKHLGDISKIKGAEIEPVDIITFGSPCQDLSVAGKRAGLKHEANGDEETTRSGLFMEAVRIIKEMREATNGKYPRFALWENVPGAFSSNKGEDFRVVCEELIKIAEPAAFMPPVPKAGWAYADSYVGDGWSLAYRVFDAQYWGVPQRRRRIHLVVDFRGERAREVLFERQGVRGYFTQGGKAWEGTTANAEGSTGANDREGEIAVPYTLKIRSGCEGGGKGALIQTDKSATLATNNDQYLFQPIPNILLDDQGGQQITIRTDGKAPTLRAETHGNLPCVMVQGFDAYNQALTGDKSMTVTCAATDSHHVPCVVKSQALFENHSQDTRYKGPLDVCPMLLAQLGTGGNNTPFVVDAVYRQGGFADYVEGEVGTLKASGGDLGGGSENLIIERRVHYIVRRLTPTECARLQGFADWWAHIEPKDNLTDEEYRFWLEVRNTHAAINGREEKEYTKKQILTWYNKLYTDSAEYKMWGNGIALPPALYVLQGMADVLSGKTNRDNEGENREGTTVEEYGTTVAVAYIAAPTDLSDAPKDIKAEIIETAEKLEAPKTVKETTEEETMEQKNIEEQTTAKENTPADFCAVAQLRRLAEERKALANLRPEEPRFSNDVRAIEYAVNVLEAVGL